LHAQAKESPPGRADIVTFASATLLKDKAAHLQSINAIPNSAAAYFELLAERAEGDEMTRGNRMKYRQFKA
jgi:hypothetical protein